MKRLSMLHQWSLWGLGYPVILPWTKQNQSAMAYKAYCYCLYSKVVHVGFIWKSVTMWIYVDLPQAEMPLDMGMDHNKS